MGCFVIIKFMYDAKVASKIVETESTKQEKGKKEVREKHKQGGEKERD